MTDLVVRKVKSGGMLKLVRGVPGVISQGVVKLERARVICPACGQHVESVAGDGRVKGYCAVAKKYVDFEIEKQRPTETRTEMPARPEPIKAGRDSRGRFIKGNIPVNKRTRSP